MVDLELLLEKMSVMGVSDSSDTYNYTLNWFRLYLVGHQQKVEISYVDERGVNRSNYTTLRLVRHGVP